MEVSKNIRSVREGKGLTQVDVANRLGTERSNYARLENRDINLTLKQVQEIADALEVSIFEIIGMPEGVSVEDKHTDTLQQLEDRLKMIEDVLKEKKKNIKLYKSFIEWVKGFFQTQFVLATLLAVKETGLREIIIDENDELDLLLIYKFNFTDEELKMIGEYLFSNSAPTYMINNFLAESGFIDEKWYIDSYKRKARERKEKVRLSEVKNWVNGIFDFLKEE